MLGNTHRSPINTGEIEDYSISSISSSMTSTSQEKQRPGWVQKKLWTKDTKDFVKTLETEEETVFSHVDIRNKTSAVLQQIFPRKKKQHSQEQQQSPPFPTTDTSIAIVRRASQQQDSTSIDIEMEDEDYSNVEEDPEMMRPDAPPPLYTKVVTIKPRGTLMEPPVTKRQAIRPSAPPEDGGTPLPQPQLQLQAPTKLNILA